MTQVKKAEVREAILAAAQNLFGEAGYNATTLRQIATAAGVSLSNVYSYYSSKLDLLFAIYEPWLKARLEQLQQEVEALDGAAARLRHTVSTLWRDIPAEDNGFANNIMQALSTAQPADYDAATIRWAEAKLTRILRSCLPEDHRRELLADETVAHLMFMAFDGFVLNHRINPAAKCTDKMIDILCKLLLCQ
jgi:AcrR family transcriptional regulator